MLIRRQRKRLLLAALVASCLFAVSAVTGLVGLIKTRTSSQPDLYKILFTNLASQHYRLTGSDTLVKEDERAIEYFNYLYELKSKRDRLPRETMEASRDSILNFSFVPNTGGIHKYPLAYLFEQQVAPSMSFTQPSGKSLTIWVYSRSERALVIVFAEQPVPGDLVDPGLRIIREIDKSKAVAIEGNFASGSIVLVHAYLLSLENSGLDWKGWPGVSSTQLKEIISSIPLLYGPDAGNKKEGHERLDYVKALALVKAGSPSVFDHVMTLLSWTVFLASSLWLLWNITRFRRLYHLFIVSLDDLAPAGQLGFEASFFRFLKSDLSIQAERILDDLIRQHREETERQQEQNYRTQLETNLSKLHDRLAELGQTVSFDNRIISGVSTDELAALVAQVYDLVRDGEQRIERDQQEERERERQIQWLESEFTAIPKEKLSEASSAWLLYEQACTEENSRKKLEILKGARKLLPKQFRT